MKITRNSVQEDLCELLADMKIGGYSVFDGVTGYEITKVPGGYIYKNEFNGLVFVPDAEIKMPPRIEPKKPGRPPKVVEK